MSLVSVIYSPLKEDQNQLAGWDKQTIEYLLKNETKVKNTIRSCGKALGQFLHKAAIDDIYSEAINYAYKNDDYNIEKAIDLSHSDSVVSLQGYVNSFVNYLVKKYVSDDNKMHPKNSISEVTNSEGESVSIFDFIPDNREDEQDTINRLSKLETICKAYESQRYAYELDIFEIWFIQLAAMKYGKQDRYNDIIESIGIKSSDIGEFRRKTAIDDIMLSIASAITIEGIERSFNVIKKYTYGAESLEKVVKLA